MARMKRRQRRQTRPREEILRDVRELSAQIPVSEAEAELLAKAYEEILSRSDERQAREQEEAMRAEGQS